MFRQLSQFVLHNLAIALLALFVCAPLRAESQVPPDRDAVRQMFDLLNQFRANSGRSLLRWDDRLAEAALDHARLVAQNRKLLHQFSNEPVLSLRLAAKDIRLNRAGENLAADISPASAHESLSMSPPHRANMLEPDYNAVGIAVVRSGETLYVVEDFAHLIPELSALQFEDQIASAFNLLRTQSGAPPVGHFSSDELRRAACEMAQNDRLDASRMRSTGARYVLAFTISDPQSLPADLKRLRANRDLTRYTMGACFSKSATYVNGTYWVVMNLFAKNSRPQ